MRSSNVRRLEVMDRAGLSGGAAWGPSSHPTCRSRRSRPKTPARAARARNRCHRVDCGWRREADFHGDAAGVAVRTAWSWQSAFERRMRLSRSACAHMRTRESPVTASRDRHLAEPATRRHPAVALLSSGLHGTLQGVHDVERLAYRSARTDHAVCAPLFDAGSVTYGGD